MTTCCYSLSEPHSKFSIIIASFPNQIYNQKYLEVKIYRVKVYVKTNFIGEVFNEEKDFWL